MKEVISVEHVESDGFDAMGFGMASTLLVVRGVGMAATLLRKKFIDCGVHVYEPTLVRCKKFGGFVGNSGAEVLMNHCNRCCDGCNGNSLRESNIWRGSCNTLLYSHRRCLQFMSQNLNNKLGLKMGIFT